MKTIFVSFYEDSTPWFTLKELGVHWKELEVQHIADQVKFIGCSNIPEILPSWFRVVDET